MHDPIRAERPIPVPVHPGSALGEPRPMSASEALSPERLIGGPLVVPEEGWRGLAYRIFRLNLGLSEAERRRRDLEAAAKTAVNQGQPRVVAVGSGKGGVGKTTVLA